MNHTTVWYAVNQNQRYCSDVIELDLVGVGERVAGYRRRNGWTAAELSAATEDSLSREVIAKIESGRLKGLPMAYVLALSWALGVPPVALLFPVERPDEFVDPEAGLRVRDMVEWFSGWSERGPMHSPRRTEAGDHASRQVLGAKTLIRRQLDVDNARAELDRALEALKVGGRSSDEIWETMARHRLSVERAERELRMTQWAILGEGGQLDGVDPASAAQGGVEWWQDLAWGLREQSALPDAADLTAITLREDDDGQR